MFIDCTNATGPHVTTILTDLTQGYDDGTTKKSKFFPWYINAPVVKGPNNIDNHDVIYAGEFSTLLRGDADNLCNTMRVGQLDSTETVRYDGGINGMGSSSSYNGRKFVTTFSTNNYSKTVAMQHVYNEYIEPSHTYHICPDGTYYDFDENGSCQLCPPGRFRRADVFGSDMKCKAFTVCDSDTEFLFMDGDATNDKLCALKSGKDHCPLGQYLAGEADIRNMTGTWSFKCIAGASQACPWDNDEIDFISANFNISVNSSGITDDHLSLLINTTQLLQEYAKNETDNGKEHPFKLVRFCADWSDCDMAFNEYQNAPGTFTSNRECTFCRPICKQTMYSNEELSDDPCKYDIGNRIPIKTGAYFAREMPFLSASVGVLHHSQCTIVPFVNAPSCCRYNYDRSIYTENAPQICVNNDYDIPPKDNTSDFFSYICNPGEGLSILSAVPGSTFPTTTITTTVVNDTACPAGQYIDTDTEPHRCEMCEEGKFNPFSGSHYKCEIMPPCGPNEITLDVPEEWRSVHGHVCGSKDNVCDDNEFAVGAADFVMEGDQPNSHGVWVIRVADTDADTGTYNESGLIRYSWNLTNLPNNYSTAEPLPGELKGTTHFRLCQHWTECLMSDNMYESKLPSETSDRECSRCPIAREGSASSFANYSCNIRPNSSGVYTTTADQDECMGVSQDNQPFCCRAGYNRHLQFYNNLDSSVTTCSYAKWHGERETTETSTTATNYTTTTTVTNTTTTTTTMFKLHVQRAKDEKAATTMGYVFFGVGGAGIVLLIIAKLRYYKPGNAYVELPSKSKGKSNGINRRQKLSSRL